VKPCCVETAKNSHHVKTDSYCRVKRSLLTIPFSHTWCHVYGRQSIRDRGDVLPRHPKFELVGQ